MLVQNVTEGRRITNHATIRFKVQIDLNYENLFTTVQTYKHLHHHSFATSSLTHFIGTNLFFQCSLKNSKEWRRKPLKISLTGGDRTMWPFWGFPFSSGSPGVIPLLSVSGFSSSGCSSFCKRERMIIFGMKMTSYIPLSWTPGCFLEVSWGIQKRCMWGRDTRWSEWHIPNPAPWSAWEMITYMYSR